MTDGAEEKVELTKKMGFTMAVRQEKLAEAIDAVGDADACVEFTGTPEGLAECVGHVRVGGIVVCVGTLAEGVDFFQETYLGIQQKELTLVGVSSGSAREMDEWVEASRDLREG